VLDAGKIALERGEERAFGAALQHLGEERAARGQHVAGELGSGLDQSHDFQMIGLAVAGGVRRHVGQDHIGGTGEQRLELVRGFRVEKIELEEFDALVRSNARAALLVTREASRQLRDGGAIVNITSVAVTRPRTYTAADSASRAAVDALTRVAALELARRDITVNAVALDLNGPCEPDQVADAVAYLLSDAARGITGQVVRVDRSTWGLGTVRNGVGPPG